MKAFLLNKINILLGVLLSLTVIAGGYFGYTYIKNNSSATVPDFLGKNKNVAITWCGQLSEEFGCEFVYEETTSTQEDVIFSQSISAGNKLNGNITFKVSSGIVVEIALPEITVTTSKTDIENWKNQNGLMYVSYIEENNDTVTKGSVIRIEPQTGIYKDTPVTVYISTGPKETVSDEIVISSGTYINSSVSDFESKVKALGLVPNHNTSRDSESATVTKGNIVWHGSGTYKKGETINYGVCTGQVSGVVVKEGQYVNKTEAEFKTIASNLGLKATHVSDRDEYSSTVAKGNIVTHGFGTYVKDEVFNYGLSLGSKEGDSTYIVVKEGQYLNKTEDEFKKIATELGLVAKHNTDWDVKTDNASNVGKVCKHGVADDYTKGEDFRYGLYTSSGSSTSYIVITNGQYVGKSETEFTKIASDLGLKAYHESSWDQETSNSSNIGKVCRHGVADNYVKGENLRYGLYKTASSTTEKVKVESGYVGKTESDFTSYLSKLGLKSSRTTQYSDSYAEGIVISYQAGEYAKGSTVSYAVSLGKDTSVNVTDKSGVSESEFLSYLSNNGLSAGTRSESYSSSIGEGKIIINDTGKKAKGTKINYTVSLGEEPEETGLLVSFADIANDVSVANDFDAAKTKLENFLKNVGFTNYTILGEESRDSGRGVLVSITVNGEKHNGTKTYPLSSKIVAVISTKYIEG